MSFPAQIERPPVTPAPPPPSEPVLAAAITANIILMNQMAEEMIWQDSDAETS